MLDGLILQIEGASAVMIGIIGIFLGLIGGSIGWKIWEEKRYEDKMRMLKIFIILTIITIITKLVWLILGSEGIILFGYIFVMSGILGGRVIGARWKEQIIGYLSGGSLGGILFAIIIGLNLDPEFNSFLIFYGYSFIILGVLGGLVAGRKWENRWVGGILGGAFLGGFFILEFVWVILAAFHPVLLLLLLPIGVTISSVLGFITHHRIIENN